MGGKKKARSKQRRAKLGDIIADAEAEAAKQEAINEQLLHIHPHDDLHRLLDHLHSMKAVTSEQLAAWMPHSLHNLQEDPALQDDFVSAVICEYLEKFDGAQLWDGSPKHKICLRLAYEAVVEVPNVRVLLGLKQFLYFWITMANFIDTTKLLSSSSEEIVAAIRKATDKACEAWAYHMDAVLFGGSKGAFLSDCPVYGMTDEAILELVHDAMNDADDHIHFELYEYLLNLRLQLAIVPLLTGFFDNSCWGCGRTHPDASCLLVCSRCKVAKYDSKTCQTMAWKGGHKHKCKGISARHEALQESIRTIERVHALHDGSSDRYLEANFVKATDYDLLSSFHGTMLFQEDNSFFEGLQGPSMTFFYENLARVQQGAFWILEDRSDGPDAEEEEERDADEKFATTEEIEDVFLPLACLLSYDMFGFAEQRHSIDYPDLVWRIVREYPIIGPFLQSLNTNSFPFMSAKRFLEVYHIYGQDWVVGLAVDGPEWDSRRRLLVQKAMDGLCEFRHT